MHALDHILWAAPDLDHGTQLFEALTGVAPGPGGSHPGFGTRNSLVSLGDGVYFEIIAPDPRQSLEGNLGGELARLAHPGLLTFALQTRDLDGVRGNAERAGLRSEGPVRMTRRRSDGVQLAWSVLRFRHAEFDKAIPFAIDWSDSPHPSTTAPGGCRLRMLAALSPEPEPLARVYRAIGAPLEVKRGARPGFLAILDTPKGDVVLLNP